jgi:hypothetical protein
MYYYYFYYYHCDHFVTATAVLASTCLAMGTHNMAKQTFKYGLVCLLIRSCYLVHRIELYALCIAAKHCLLLTHSLSRLLLLALTLLFKL